MVEITRARFQEIVLQKPIDVEGQIFSKSLDAVPKNAWQSFLIWLDKLLKKVDEDQFDSLPLAMNIQATVLNLDSQFFEEIPIEQIQQGIDNLKALNEKLTSKPDKREMRDSVARVLNRSIFRLEDFHREKVVLQQKKAEEQRILMFLQSEEVNRVFKEKLPFLARIHTDCISCFGIDNLREGYAQTSNPEHFLVLAKLRKETLSSTNKEILEEVGKYFTDKKQVLQLLFPEHKENFPELVKLLNEGYITFPFAQAQRLVQVIRDPAAAQKKVEEKVPDFLPIFADSPQDIENKRVLRELLALRNERPYAPKQSKKVEPIAVRQPKAVPSLPVQVPEIVSAPVKTHPEAVVTKVRETVEESLHDAKGTIETTVLQVRDTAEESLHHAKGALQEAADSLKVGVTNKLAAASSFFQGVFAAK
ncbi:MAG: hypothetical protein JSS60_07385 [Verrucomicrobia bacterium]|nr:hypothetical protein [Verrucomicrobiota bacterium]